MPHVAIPDWTSLGVLPPNSLENPTSSDRSPYRVSLKDLVKRFSTNQKRIEILSGFLKYRTELHTMGLIHGFQWLDGSFMESVETLENRPPNDLDVVTFYDLPEHLDQEQLPNSSKYIFDRKRMKTEFLVDCFYVQRNGDDPDTLIELTTYWYSLWSHRRNHVWRGYLQVNLAPDEDESARHALHEIISREA